jgi:hypothetical protein
MGAGKGARRDRGMAGDRERRGMVDDRFVEAKAFVVEPPKAASERLLIADQEVGPKLVDGQDDDQSRAGRRPVFARAGEGEDGRERYRQDRSHGESPFRVERLCPTHRLIRVRTGGFSSRSAGGGSLP